MAAASRTNGLLGRARGRARAAHVTHPLLLSQGVKGEKGEAGNPGLPGFSGPKGPTVSVAMTTG